MNARNQQPGTLRQWDIDSIHVNHHGGHGCYSPVAWRGYAIGIVQADTGLGWFRQRAAYLAGGYGHMHILTNRV